ncbi:hypothetical protein F4859DRAFT_53972 [Xylaria cf. heliscus]|nr:hypothetical protein F4859DRAFT_53972 [Xylaria cf. heliscus]
MSTHIRMADDAAKTRANFFSLPSELRNGIYELVLLHLQEPLDPWAYYFRLDYIREDSWLRGQLTPGLLRANKAVHREAGSLFYGKNCFNLSNTSPEQLVSFLEQIGGINASYIRHVVIDFPLFRSPSPGHGVALVERSVDILAAIQSHCINLSSLRTSPRTLSSMELIFDNADNDKVATKALQLVDAHFRAIKSPQEIIIEVYEDAPSDHVRQRMKSHGWTITTVAYGEVDWDRAFTDFDDFDFRPGYDGDSGNNDNDD